MQLAEVWGDSDVQYMMEMGLRVDPSDVDGHLKDLLTSPLDLYITLYKPILELLAISGFPLTNSTCLSPNESW